MKTLKEQKWMIIVYGIVLFAVGLIDLVLSIVDLGSAIRVVSYSIACGLFVIGMLHIITSLVKETKTFFKGALVLGSIAIALGVVFIVEPDVLGVYLIYFAAAFVLAMSVIFAIKAALAIKYKYKNWIFWYILFAVIGITASILALVYGKSATVAQIIYISMGALAAVSGIALIIYGIKAINKKAE